MNNLASAMPFANVLGIDASDATPERVNATLTVTEELCTVGNAVHGGALMAFADAVGAIGAYLNLPDGATGTTTIESKSNFVGRAVAGDNLRALATPLSVGRRLSVWQTRITTDDETDGEKLIAIVTQTQLVL
ncbi:MAG: PaaI family thioesterase [Pseudomonadota bacterium]